MTDTKLVRAKINPETGTHYVTRHPSNKKLAIPGDGDGVLVPSDTFTLRRIGEGSWEDVEATKAEAEKAAGAPRPRSRAAGAE